MMLEEITKYGLANTVVVFFMVGLLKPLFKTLVKSLDNNLIQRENIDKILIETSKISSVIKQESFCTTEQFNSVATMFLKLLCNKLHRLTVDLSANDELKSNTLMLNKIISNNIDTIIEEVKPFIECFKYNSRKIDDIILPMLQKDEMRNVIVEIIQTSSIPKNNIDNYIYSVFKNITSQLK